MKQITVYAHAKINLALDVLNRRPNGYHSVRMVMQSLSLHDTLTLLKTDTPGISLSCTNPAQFPDVTWDENNLIYKAAKLWFETYPSSYGVHIVIEKHIPSAAGLAGGSSDAAATLRGLKQLFGKLIPMAQLQEMGAKLGADVPYCIMLGTALSEGIGELLTPLPSAPSLYCTIVKPDTDISTKYIYEHLSLPDAMHPNVDAVIRSINNANIPSLCMNLGNILEPVAKEVCPEITEIEHKMKELGALGVGMSGSGPTVFGLFIDGNQAIDAADYFNFHGYPNTSFATRFHQP